MEGGSDLNKNENNYKDNHKDLSKNINDTETETNNSWAGIIKVGSNILVGHAYVLR
jgi:hypothetical protein